MNKTRLAFAIVITAGMTLMSCSVVQAATLRNGSTGDEVKTVQTELNELGYNVGIVDGVFGAKTTAAVKQFQLGAPLQVDGIVGAKTTAALTVSLRQKTTNDIIAEANKYLGVPYLWGGTTTKGFDCSGFVQYVFNANGIALPRVSQDQYKQGTSVAFADLQPGDLVFFTFYANRHVSHVGIYLGGGRFINASQSKGVTIYPLGEYWKSIYVGAKRVN